MCHREFESGKVKERIISERLHLSAVCIGVKNDSIIYAPLSGEEKLGSLPSHPQRQKTVKEEKKSKAEQ